jgi:hypothetical protein
VWLSLLWCYLRNNYIPSSQLKWFLINLSEDSARQDRLVRQVWMEKKLAHAETGKAGNIDRSDNANPGHLLRWKALREAVSLVIILPGTCFVVGVKVFLLL